MPWNARRSFPDSPFENARTVTPGVAYRGLGKPVQNAMPRALFACDLGRARFCSFALFGDVGLGRLPPDAVRRPIASLGWAIF